MNRGDMVVNILIGKCGMIVERYHHNYNPHYADWRIWFEDNSYLVVRERHLRKAMLGEVLRFKKNKC